MFEMVDVSRRPGDRFCFWSFKTAEKLDHRMPQVFPEQSLEPLARARICKEGSNMHKPSYISLDVSKSYIDLHQLPQEQAARFE